MCSCLSFCRMRREYCNPAAVRNNRFESQHFLTVRLVFLSATEKPSLPVVRPTSISRSRLFRLPRGSNQKHRRERERERVDITTPAGPSDARGSVAIVLPHLPSICRRSIFNKLPASLPLFPSLQRTSTAPAPARLCYWPGNTLS